MVRHRQLAQQLLQAVLILQYFYGQVTVNIPQSFCQLCMSPRNLTCVPPMCCYIILAHLYSCPRAV